MVSLIPQDFDNGWALPENCVPAKSVREALSILEAINTGELLAALPEHDSDRRRHETAVSLLGLMERTLREALAGATAAAQPATLRSSQAGE
jgi:hypothetical protein